MEKEFIPFELEVKLKKLRCDKFLCYLTHDPYPTEHKGILWQQAFDWFWDKYEMWGEYFPWNPQINNWKIAIFYKVNGEYNDSEYFINGNLNEARQSCLEKLIELCQQN